MYSHDKFANSSKVSPNLFDCLAMAVFGLCVLLGGWIRSTKVKSYCAVKCFCRFALIGFWIFYSLTRPLK